MPALSVKEVEKTYSSDQQAVAALRGISFEISRGSFVALRGPSGCGKSTLLHLVGGMDQPTRGSIFVGDANLAALNDDELAKFRRRRIGFVFQFFNLLPTLTVRENVKLPLLLDGSGDKESSRRADEFLNRVGLAPRASHFPAALSGGEMQRAAVARAVIARPELLIADEPTGNLDSESGLRVMELLQELNRDIGVTILLATHSEEAARYAGRVICMRDGLIETDNVVQTAGSTQ